MFRLVIALLLLVKYVSSFQLPMRKAISNKRIVSMEYIPDGLSKEKWAELKRKEAEANKGKDLAAIGITKFKSRSFEAWQKSGQKNLFPVDPNSPLESRPYMQRPGGSADGEDLKKKGLFSKATDQAKVLAKTDVDLKYEQLEKEGKLRSSPFSLPWTSDATAKLSAAANKKPAATTTTKPTSTTNKSTSKTPVKPIVEEPPKKKGFFGLF